MSIPLTGAPADKRANPPADTGTRNPYERRPGLPDVFWSTLIYGDARYDSDESLVGRLVQLACDHGADVDWLLVQLRNPKHEAGHEAFKGHVRQRDREVRKFYDRTARQRRKGERLEPDSLALFIVELRERALTGAWPSAIEVRHERAGKVTTKRVTGAMLRRAFLAHLTLAADVGRDHPYTASCRHLAEVAGMNHDTAMWANRALKQVGVVEHVRSKERHVPLKTARRFRLALTVAPLVAITTPPVLPVESGCGQSSDSGTPHQGLCKPAVPTLATGIATLVAGHDGFRYGTGLRHDVFALIEAHDGAADISTLVQDLGRAARTTRRHVAALVDAGLVLKHDDGTLQVSGDELHVRALLDEVAASTGTADRARAQVVRHEQHRKARNHELLKRMVHEHAKKRGHVVRHDGIVDPATGAVLTLDEYAAAHLRVEGARSQSVTQIRDAREERVKRASGFEVDAVEPPPDTFGLDTIAGAA